MNAANATADPPRQAPPQETQDTSEERIWIVGDTMTLKATGVETDGRLLVIENLTAPGGGPPLHVHRNEDESFYVLEGEFEIVSGERTIHAGAGSFAFVPRGTPHRFQNVGSAPARILIWFSPAGLEGFFREAGVPATNDGPAPPLGPAELQRTRLAAPRYGLELAQPPSVEAKEPTMSEPCPDRSRQTLTLDLDGVTAGDYLAWVRDPDPPALGRGLCSVEVEAAAVGPTITATLEWPGPPPAPLAAASIAGFPLTEDVRAIRVETATGSRPVAACAPRVAPAMRLEPGTEPARLCAERRSSPRRSGGPSSPGS